jgi:hypothetical protein
MAVCHGFTRSAAYDATRRTRSADRMCGPVPKGCGYYSSTSPMLSAWCQSAGHEPSKEVFQTSGRPVALSASTPVLPWLTLLLLAPPFPHWGLRPWGHPHHQPLWQRPDMVGQPGRHRQRTRPPLLRCARPVGGLRTYHGGRTLACGRPKCWYLWNTTRCWGQPSSPWPRVFTRRPTAAPRWRRSRLRRSPKAVLIGPPHPDKPGALASSVPHPPRWVPPTRRRRRTVFPPGPTVALAAASHAAWASGLCLGGGGARARLRHASGAPSSLPSHPRSGTAACRPALTPGPPEGPRPAP